MSTTRPRRAATTPGTSVPTPRPPAELHPALDVSVVLPCRNEAATVAHCVRQALTWIARRRLTGEVLVVDNASSDDSAALAARAGARVAHEPLPGYGRALRTGITAAAGRVVVMADADATYDLTDLDAFYDPVAAHSADLVIGDRLTGLALPGAMTATHRWGNHALSALTRRLTGTAVNDVHCGLRSFDRATMLDLPAWSTGMEFATHMLTHAHTHQLRIDQTAITLAPPALGRRSHLRPVHDGIRHLATIAAATTRRRRQLTE